MSEKMNEKQIEVSIIVPIYNVEKYIRANVESLIALINPNIEIIYVDDGSLDHSAAIIKEYQKKDSRIKIVKRENGGLSAARNSGVAVAQGKWILFVDGDDWIDARLTEELINASTDENDMVWGTFEVVTETGELEKHAICDKSSIGSIKDGIVWMMEKKVSFTPWVYLYRTALIKENGLIFPEGFLHEDMEFIPKVFYYAKNVKYVGVPFYKYVNRCGSISRTKNLKRITDLIKIAQRLENFEKEEVNNLEYRDCLRMCRGMICANALHVAILDGLSWKDVFADRKLKVKAISYLMHSTRRRDEIIGIAIMFHLQWIYTRLYLLYNLRVHIKESRK